jgi:KaiC/GvpD/RAD55 family RecA-like ATPase
VAEIKRIRTYIRGLDEHIEGGIPEGSVTLFCGTPGTMKSSLTYSIAYNNANKEGKRTLYLTLEQSVDSLMQQMETLQMPSHTDVRVIDFDSIQETLEKSTLEFNWIERVRNYIIESKREYGYDILVIDSLDALYSLTRIEDPRREVYHFFKALRDTGITTFLISEMSPDSKRFSFYGIEDFMADGIIHLDFQKRGDVLSSLERYIGVVKIRATNHDTQYFPILYQDGGFTVFGREDLELE